MNRCRNLFFVALVLLAGSSMGFGQLTMSLSSNVKYRQDPTTVNFRKPGYLNLSLKDGSIMVSSCVKNGQLTWFASSTIPPCPTGATGFIVSGDVGGGLDDEGNVIPDGIRDDASYWEVTTITPAVAIEPSRPELCTLYALPPSTMPRPIGVFNDNTVIAYWNIQDKMKEYKNTGYQLALPFNTRDEMDSAVVKGDYTFNFPRLTTPDVPVRIPVTYYSIPEGYLKRNNTYQGFRYIRVNGATPTWTTNNFVPLDPRLINKFEWEGNSTNFIFPSADELYFAVLKLVAAPAGDPTREPIAEPTLFPGSVVPGKNARVLLPSSLQTSFTMPPGFSTIAIGDEAIVELTLVRNVPTSTVASDTSERRYQLPVKFVDTYEGWATLAINFPVGTPAAKRARDADPDGDKYTNYQEYIGKSKPMVATSTPLKPALAFVQGRAVRASSTATTGFWESTVEKNQGAYPPITYEYEFTTDLSNWSTVGADDPNWLLIETPEAIKVQSKNAKLSGSGFLRVKTVQAAEAVPN